MSNLLAKRYEIIRTIGQGGMADVYLARDTILNREVAIKILRGELNNDAVSLIRFKREAAAISNLSHPNIVQIYDVGEEAGRQYIVMEYIHGKTLKKLISERGALYKEESVSIMKQLISAVTAACQQGIIHRDIKPQNVLIKDDGTVKITDFGIALAQDAIQLTQQDSVMGSVHYLAPELARGETATPQSDIYSLGIVFFELLTGEVPFRGDTAVQIAMKHIQEEIPSVRQFNPTLPQSLDNVVIKATAKNKMNRYRTPNEMLEDISTALSENRKNEEVLNFHGEGSEEETKVIPKITAIPKRKKGINKNQSIMIGVGVVVVAVLAIFFLYSLVTGSGNKTVKIPDVSNMEVADARAALEEAGLEFDAPQTKYEVTDDIDRGKVIKTVPAADTVVDRGTKVSLVVSDGKYIVVQDYRGFTLEEVEAIFVQTKVIIRKEYAYDADIETGKIISQKNVSIGDKIDPTKQVELILVIAKPNEIRIPADIIGRNINDAISYFTEQGFTVEPIALPTDGLTEEYINSRGGYFVVIDIFPNPNALFIQTSEDATIKIYYYGN
jgi:Serine/threonine protein kinase